MPKTIKILSILLLTTLCSCTKKFLDVDNKQSPFRESYIKDLPSMQEYANGLYFMLSYYFESSESGSSYAELVSDNIMPFSSSSTQMPYYNWKQNAIGDMNLNMGNYWLNIYLTIRSCNFVINEIGKYKNENPVKADYIKGQALAIRSLLYFKLVNIFAQPFNFTTDGSHPGVPYITENDITTPYRRQSVAEVYDAIISDLKESIELMPLDPTDTRFMSRNAAMGLLARVYLFKQDYGNAKMMALEITNKVPLMAISAGYPNDMYKLKSPTSTEVLFQLTPTSSSNFLGVYVRRRSNRYNLVSTQGLASLLLEDPNDIRVNWIKKIPGALNAPDTITITKFPMGVASEANPAVTVLETAYYPAVLRSSEIFLVVAEAAAKTNDEVTARMYLNAIRKRANPLILDITATGQALQDSIEKERRKELCFESLRMFDLQRWKKGVNRADVLPGSPANLSFPSEKGISPIPITEVRIANISQNDGY